MLRGKRYAKGRLLIVSSMGIIPMLESERFSLIS
jgi:hypothetical protein